MNYKEKIIFLQSYIDSCKQYDDMQAKLHETVSVSSPGTDSPSGGTHGASSPTERTAVNYIELFQRAIHLQIRRDGMRNRIMNAVSRMHSARHAEIIRRVYICQEPLESVQKWAGISPSALHSAIDTAIRQLPL